GWFGAWMRAFGDRAEPIVLAARRGDRLEAVLPLLDGRRVRSPTNSHTPVFDLVSDDDEAARTVVDELLGMRFQQLDIAYLEQGGRIYALKGGYDPAWRKLSPSYLLIEETIARGYANGMESYELLGDADPYKLRLTDSVRARDHLQAFGRGPIGGARKAAYRH